MRNIIKKILRESSDWDWIADVPDSVPFELVQLGKTYRIEVEDELLRALESCDEYDYIFTRGRYAVVEDKKMLSHNSIFCHSGIEDEVLSLRLDFLDSNKNYIDYFWVSQDMVNLYEI